MLAQEPDALNRLRHWQDILLAPSPRPSDQDLDVVRDRAGNIAIGNCIPCDHTGPVLAASLATIVLCPHCHQPAEFIGHYPPAMAWGWFD